MREYIQRVYGIICSWTLLGFIYIGAIQYITCTYKKSKKKAAGVRVYAMLLYGIGKGKNHAGYECYENQNSRFFLSKVVKNGRNTF